MKKHILFLMICSFSSCLLGGGLGGFAARTFPISKRRVFAAVDTLFTKHPEYLVPKNLAYLDNWNERGFGFLSGRVFYFQSPPKELYYVSFVGDTRATTSEDYAHNTDDTSNFDYPFTEFAIRAVSDGTQQWQKEDEFIKSEKDRIQKRFDDEIILKLEQILSVKSNL